MSQVMYKFEGSKYRETRGLSVVEIAKLIKQQFKTEYPNIKLSVKTQVYSGGCSINAHITELNEQIFTPEYLQYRTDPDSILRRELFSEYCIIKRISCVRFTKKVLAILERLEEIGKSFNFDDSDSQTDYFHNSFYYFSGIDYQLEHAKIESESLVYCQSIGEVIND
jgi:hypothetical protein